MPHELDLDPWLTLEQNIRFFGLLHSVSLETINTRMVQFSRDLHIVPYLGKMVKDISPGIIRMGMIVRTLVHDPDILIMDDPTAFMDAESYRYTWDLLLRLKGKKTILYVSQSLQEVESAHDRILVLENGRIALDGSLDRLLGSTFEFHQFQIEFDNLSDELYKSLSNIATVVSPSRINNIFHFYGRERSVFFDIVRAASENYMIDLNVKKLGLVDLMDSEFAGGGLD